MTSFPFKTEPFKHQLEEFEGHRDDEYRGLFWEMGVAKTKCLIDQISHLWLTGKIDGLLIIAPEGAQAQWVDDEIPAHMPLQVQDSLDTFVWFTSKAGNKGFQRDWQTFLKREVPAGLSVLSMTYDSLMTEKGAHAAKAFLKSRRCCATLDESTVIKTPGTKVTKRTLAMGRHAPFRRIANGTPVSDSPFHAYSQIKFLNPDAWKHLGIQDAEGFRTYFGVFERRMNQQTNRQYPHLVCYRNLEDMHAVVAAHGSRLLKRDVFPDLPPKLYSKHYFELTPTQRKAYGELKEEYRTWIGAGELVTADLAIVRQTRLQQITSGYIPADDEEELTPLVDPKDNPRLKLLDEVLDQIPEGGKVIIWGKYNIDVDLIARRLMHRKWEAVTWDGRTSQADRRSAKERFTKGTARAFVGKPSSSAARGLNLQVADTVIYYNNSFVLDDRQQSEDRAHRPGIHHPVKYIDIVAKGTVDTHIVASLRKKRDVSAAVTGDQLDDWL